MVLDSVVIPFFIALGEATLAAVISEYIKCNACKFFPQISLFSRDCLACGYGISVFEFFSAGAAQFIYSVSLWEFEALS